MFNFCFHYHFYDIGKPHAISPVYQESSQKSFVLCFNDMNSMFAVIDGLKQKKNNKKGLIKKKIFQCE